MAVSYILQNRPPSLTPPLFPYHPHRLHRFSSLLYRRFQHLLRRLPLRSQVIFCAPRICTREFDVGDHGFDRIRILEELLAEEEAGKISVRDFFYLYQRCLKSMQAGNSKHIVPPRSSNNSIALRLCGPPRQSRGPIEDNRLCYRYMVVYQYGAAVVFNVEDDEVDFYLQAVRQHASGLLMQMRKHAATKRAFFLHEEYTSDLVEGMKLKFSRNQFNRSSVQKTIIT